MSRPSPFARSFVVGALLFIAVALQMVSRHSGHWSTYPPRNLIVLLVGWVITGLLVGLVASRFQKLHSWLGVSLLSVPGSILVLSLMLLVVEVFYAPRKLPEFKNDAEMMAYFAAEAGRWVKKDRNIDLDYSLESIKVVEEELARISRDVDPVKPPQGTFGIAMGYGAYIGEVLRGLHGGSWHVEQPIQGPGSYALHLKDDNTAYPVSWCWKRLTEGEGDNVFAKASILNTIINEGLPEASEQISP